MPTRIGRALWIDSCGGRVLDVSPVVLKGSRAAALRPGGVSREAVETRLKSAGLGCVDRVVGRALASCTVCTSQLGLRLRWRLRLEDGDIARSPSVKNSPIRCLKAHPPRSSFEPYSLRHSQSVLS